MIDISKKARVSPLADIQESKRGTRIIIKDSVMIDSFVKIFPVGGDGDVIIEENSYINSGTVIQSGNGVFIGKNVLIAPNCTLAAVNHQYRDKSPMISKQGFKESKGGIRIEDDVWIGANCVILDGAVLRKGCVVGANSLVNREITEYSICMGSPAQVVGRRE